MAFLTDDDYDVQLRSEIGRIIDTTDDKVKLRKAEDMAIAQIKNYIGGRYDLDKIFNCPKDERNDFIVMITIDIALYHLWSKEGANKIPQTRTDRYADALEWLKAVQKGADTQLPLLETNSDQSGNLRIWSKHKASNNRF